MPEPWEYKISAALAEIERLQARVAELEGTVAAEREACAKMCDVASNTMSIGFDYQRGYSTACKAMADAIRARGDRDGR